MAEVCELLHSQAATVASHTEDVEQQRAIMRAYAVQAIATFADEGEQSFGASALPHWVGCSAGRVAPAGPRCRRQSKRLAGSFLREEQVVRMPWGPAELSAFSAWQVKRDLLASERCC